MSHPSTGPSSQPSETSFKRKRGVFQKDLQHMMYGFGDDPNILAFLGSSIDHLTLAYVTWIRVSFFWYFPIYLEDFLRVTTRYLAGNEYLKEK
ncbi:hypothetical protein ERO13_D07G231500v2 [Gossypium hirsutum]|uniref:Transcription initiation factor TFIID subunit 13 n=2 Tax=Gossypium TaxID=3633 RepID=A0A1U8LDY5_GOSHI|nr:transcription initiation factor TFIID subunit 13-like [Gossypium hirsutum]KAG4140032.1 hypothetical protein ERO13_D07G231500v2 [Gossypium hirsutum]TYH64515.1 hypothetical protein ES332_D07G272400v1 [Gossypium tomentosum]